MHLGLEIWVGPRALSDLTHRRFYSLSQGFLLFSLSLNLRVSIQHSHASLLLRLLWHLLDSRFCKSLSLKLFGAFGLYVCQFKDLCQYWTKSFKCDGFSYVWYYLLVKVWLFLYMMSFTRSWWVYLCELDWGLRLKLNCYSYYYLCGSSIWWVLCCGDLLGSYDFQNAKNDTHSLSLW